MSLFKRFVEIGRIVVLRNGPDAGKIATIVDVLDQNRAMIDGPWKVTGVPRQVVNFKDVALTDIVVEIPRSIRHKGLAKQFAKQEILSKWNNTKWSKRIESRKTRSELNDFGRFHAMIAKKTRNHAINQRVKKLVSDNHPRIKPKQ